MDGTHKEAQDFGKKDIIIILIKNSKQNFGPRLVFYHLFLASVEIRSWDGSKFPTMFLVDLNIFNKNMQELPVRD